MTSNGWTAQLEDFEVILACNTPYSMYPGVDLYDMADDSQDGVISTADSGTRTQTSTLSEESPPVGSVFTLDVTAALRHDLFSPAIVCVLAQFAWPDGAGTATEGVRWIGAMTDPEILSVLGSVGTWEFGWGQQDAYSC